MPALLLALIVAATMATANTVGFELRAFGLEQRWAADQAAGVPAADLADARAQLGAAQARRAGVLPYAVVSGAALVDPFSAAEASASGAYRSAMAAAHARAADAESRLHDAGGPNDQGEAGRLVQLARAVRPADADALARRWNARADALAGSRLLLAAESGGLTGGLPTDVVSAAGELSDLASLADGLGVETAEAGAALIDAQGYMGRPYPGMLAGHRDAIAELRAAVARLQGQVDARARAYDVLARDADLIQLVTQFGAGDQFQSRLDQVRAGVAAATASRDDAALRAALARLQELDADLQPAANGWLPTAGIPCEQGAPAQLIRIHLVTQQLVAYQDGCPILRTPVTTGRNALPTGRGTFHIYYKAATYHMISPWPLGNPFYYPPTWVADAMEFIGNGTFIHSADWQPASSYGPGSQYGPYASHGCVHVIDGPLQQLYDWAAIGATVVVED